jgi:hypothetical protein
MTNKQISVTGVLKNWFAPAPVYKIIHIHKRNRCWEELPYIFMLTIKNYIYFFTNFLDNVNSYQYYFRFL